MLDFLNACTEGDLVKLEKHLNDPQVKEKLTAKEVKSKDSISRNDEGILNATYHGKAEILKRLTEFRYTPGMWRILGYTEQKIDPILFKEAVEWSVGKPNKACVKAILDDKDLATHFAKDAVLLTLAAEKPNADMFDFLMSFKIISNHAHEGENWPLRLVSGRGEDDHARIFDRLLQAENVKQTAHEKQNAALRNALVNGKYLNAEFLMTLPNVLETAHELLFPLIKEGHQDAVVWLLRNYKAIRDHAHKYDNKALRLARFNGWQELEVELLKIVAVHALEEILGARQKGPTEIVRSLKRPDRTKNVDDDSDNDNDNDNDDDIDDNNDTKRRKVGLR